MIGELIIGIGAGIGLISGMPEALSYFKKARTESEKVEIDRKRTAKFMHLFRNMGLIDEKKGQWVQATDYKCTANYSQIAFLLSDNLSSGDFIKSLVNIQEKLKKKHLEIYYEDGRMYFRSRHENIPLLPYSFKSTPKHLVPIGVDIEDDIIYWDLSKEPHMLICGQTGCGKSRLGLAIVNHLINNLQAKLCPVDLKRGMELGFLQHITLTMAYADVLADVEKVINAFDSEGERRYEIMKNAGTGYRDYNEYIKDHPNSNLKRCFLIIEEYADITRAANGDVINRIIELGAKVRALGLHIIVMTQRPTQTFISADLKANMSIIGMKVANEHNSRLIIDETGLEQLQRGQGIGLLNSKKIFFRAFAIEPDTVLESAAKYTKATPKKQKEALNKNPIRK